MKTALLDKTNTKKKQSLRSGKSLDEILSKKSAVLNDILSRADLSTLSKSS